MAKKKKITTKDQRSFSPIQVTFGVAILAAVSILALAIMMLTSSNY